MSLSPPILQLSPGLTRACDDACICPVSERQAVAKRRDCGMVRMGGLGGFLDSSIASARSHSLKRNTSIRYKGFSTNMRDAPPPTPN